MTLKCTKSPRKRKLVIDQNSKNSENEIRTQIQTEFQILQSLIPDIANRTDISEVGFHSSVENSDFMLKSINKFFLQLEIIDACVDYIENLQNQLSHHWSSKLARKSFLTSASEIVKSENVRHNVRLR